MSGKAMALTTSLRIRSTTARGVPAGMNHPCHPADAKPGRSAASATVGTCATGCERLAPGDGQRLEAALLDQRHGGGKRDDRHLDFARDQRRVDVPVAAERHRDDVDASGMLEHLHRQVQRIARSARAVIELARIGAGARQQVLHRLDAGLRAGHQHQVRRHDLRYRTQSPSRRRTAGCGRARARSPRHWCCAGWCSRRAAISPRRRRPACRPRRGGSRRRAAARPARRPCCRSAAPGCRQLPPAETARSAGSGGSDRSALPPRRPRRRQHQGEQSVPKQQRGSHRLNPASESAPPRSRGQSVQSRT